MEGPLLHGEALGPQPCGQDARREEGDVVAGGEPEHAHGERLLGPAPQGLPPGPLRHLLDHEHPAGGELGGAGRQQGVLVALSEEVQHVDDDHGGPGAGGDVAGEGDGEVHVGVVAGNGRRVAGGGDLALVDVDPQHAPAGRGQGQVEREQAVSATDLEDPPGGRDRRGHGREGAGAPAQAHMGAHRRRQACVAGEGVHPAATRAAWVAPTKPWRARAARAGGPDSAASSSTHR